MTDTVTITIDDAEARALFAELVRRGTDMTALMRKAAGHLASATEDAFADERAPDGAPWIDLSPVTKAKRALRGAWPGRKLQVSGQLAASISTAHGKDFAEIGSNMPYARIQQQGGTAGRGRKVAIPARPFIGLSEEARAAIVDDMLAWVDVNRPAT